MVLSGMRDLLAARRFLADESLEQAAEHVWRAMFHRDEWPSELQERASALIPLFFREGPIKVTVNRLSPADRETLRARLLELIEPAE